MGHPQVLEVESTRCPLCRGEDSEPFIFAEDLLMKRHGLWRYVRCGNCDLVYLNPRPTQKRIHEIYNNEAEAPLPYHIPDAAILGNRRSSLYRGVRNLILSGCLNYPFYKSPLRFLGRLAPVQRKLRIDMFPPYIPGGRVLEVGCSYGLRLLKLKELGWDVEGIETNDASVRKAESLGLKVAGGIYEEDSIQYESESFDVILMSMVLEHVLDLSKTMLKTYRTLRSDGYFIFSTPVITGLEFRWYREFCYMLHPPFHLQLFSPATLKRLLNKAGFRNVKIYYQYFDRDFVASSQYRFEKTGKRDLFFHLGSHRFLRRMILRPLLYALSWLGQTSRVTVWAQK